MCSYVLMSRQQANNDNKLWQMSYYIIKGIKGHNTFTLYISHILIKSLNVARYIQVSDGFEE